MSDASDAVDHASVVPFDTFHGRHRFRVCFPIGILRAAGLIGNRLTGDIDRVVRVQIHHPMVPQIDTWYAVVRTRNQKRIIKPDFERSRFHLAVPVRSADSGVSRSEPQMPLSNV